jgi:hypothetical protein
MHNLLCQTASNAADIKDGKGRSSMQGQVSQASDQAHRQKAFKACDQEAKGSPPGSIQT